MITQDFTVNIDDKEVVLTIMTPSSADSKEANKVYNTAFTEALQSKAVVRARLDDLLVDQGLWDTNKQQQFDTVQREILDGEKRLAKGGIPLKEARQIALEMRDARNKLRDLISVKTNLDTMTAEGQADNAKFNYLVYACTVYKDTKKKFFNNYAEYQEKSNTPQAVKAAQTLANVIYGLDTNYEEKLPENKFLKQYKFVDDKLRLVNKDGQLIDLDGRRINEAGKLINDAGQPIDRFGNLLTDTGDYDVSFSPFLDDDGKPVGEATVTEPANKPVVAQTEEAKPTL